MAGKITRRDYALGNMVNAPLDVTVDVPEKRTRDPNGEREWRLQAQCIRNIRDRQQYDKTLAFMAPGAAQSKLTPAQRGFAKMMGYQSGILDIWLMRQADTSHGPTIKWHIVELKLPRKPLSPEQEAWFLWLEAGGVFCSRVDTLARFLTILDSF